MRTLRLSTLVLGLAFAMAATACGDDGTGDDDDDGSGAGNTTGGTACEQLAAKCPHCTLPQLQATCEAAVSTHDEASCQDGLTDPDVQANCN